jgi:hypothetical protein
MKYLLTIFFLSIGFAALSQTGNTAVGGTGAKRPAVSLTPKQIDSLINAAPHPDSLVISVKHLSAVLEAIDKEWTGANGRIASAAFQKLFDMAFADLKKRRTEYYKQKN